MFGTMTESVCTVSLPPLGFFCSLSTTLVSTGDFPGDTRAGALILTVILL